VNTLGQRLKKLRERENLSQKRAAEIFGITNTQLSRYENDIHSPDPELLRKFADYYNVSTDHIVGHTHSVTKESTSTYATEGDELDEIKKIISDNPRIGIFFKDLLEHPEESREEILEIWEVIKQRRAGRDKQGN
jgi:transcriptional regulator with XRE-family HTH domain